jgi:hypothetical protein
MPSLLRGTNRKVQEEILCRCTQLEELEIHHIDTRPPKYIDKLSKLDRLIVRYHANDNRICVEIEMKIWMEGLRISTLEIGLGAYMEVWIVNPHKCKLPNLKTLIITSQNSGVFNTRFDSYILHLINGFPKLKHLVYKANRSYHLNIGTNMFFLETLEREGMLETFVVEIVYSNNWIKRDFVEKSVTMKKRVKNLVCFRVLLRKHFKVRYDEGLISVIDGSDQYVDSVIVLNDIFLDRYISIFEAWMYNVYP